MATSRMVQSTWLTASPAEHPRLSSSPLRDSCRVFLLDARSVSNLPWKLWPVPLCCSYAAGGHFAFRYSTSVKSLFPMCGNVFCAL